MARRRNTTRLRVTLCLAVSAVLLALSGVAQADLPPLPEREARWHQEAVDRLWADACSYPGEDCGDGVLRDGRTFWDVSNDTLVGIWQFDELPRWEGGAHLGVVYVVEGSRLLGWCVSCEPFSAYDLQWLDATGRCESHNTPTIDTGNGYYGEHQWLQSTWDNVARALGRPDLVGAYIPGVDRTTQRRFALYLRDHVGRGQWPTCGNLV